MSKNLEAHTDVGTAQAGFGPATSRLTVDYSTTELLSKEM